MRWYERDNGISVLIACQNEEVMLGACVLSFLDFADEIIIVDNGSTDQSKLIAQDLQALFPEKIQFHDVPDLPDLHHNRQYAFQRSSYRWVVRADADFVAYTEGEYDIKIFREYLLSLKRSILPKVFSVPLPNVTCDFWHTGIEKPPEGLGPNDPGRYVTPPVTRPTLRIYEVFPGFKFKRLGRWEGVVFQRFLHLIRIELDKPLWMHCTLKTERGYLFRSERTNWRELGDFKKFPTLESYVLNIIQEKYNTSDIDEAAEIFMHFNVYPFLTKYDPNKYYPYPNLVKKLMTHNMVYKISINDGVVNRKDCGFEKMVHRKL
jgi:glycosyltransferase involved in cell wall biosynthesis